MFYLFGVDLQSHILDYVLRDFELTDETFLCEPTESHIIRKNTVIMRRREVLPKETYPGLLQWDLYLKTLANSQQQQQSPEETLIGPWLEIFSGGNEFFFEFFSEWIDYVSKYLSDK